MANVNIRFNGKEFLLSCDDGQEEHLEELSEHLNKKFVNLKSELGNIGESKLLLITSIKVMDEYFETKKKIEEKKKEIGDKYEELIREHEKIKKELYSYKQHKTKEQTKVTEFSEKIDELNQETDTLLEEIDKWPM